MNDAGVYMKHVLLIFILLFISLAEIKFADASCASVIESSLPSVTYKITNHWNGEGKIGFLVLHSKNGDRVLPGSTLHFAEEPVTVETKVSSDGESFVVELKVTARHYELKGDYSLLFAREWPSAVVSDVTKQIKIESL